jgi:hypothetical protein
MRPLRLIGSAALAALALPGAVSNAQPAPAVPACVAIDADLPQELASWRTKARALAGSVLQLGEAGTATLTPIPIAQLPVAPERSPEPGTLAGAFRFVAPEAGAYRVALGHRAWIDVAPVEGAGQGRFVASSSHGRGPACSSIRKMVTFQLRAGQHVLQISGAADASMPVLITRERD